MSTMLCLTFGLMLSLLSGSSEEGRQKVQLLVLFDNHQGGKSLTSSWGFAALVKYRRNTILFDTGNDAQILLHNMSQLGVDPHSITAVFISHMHHDHVGGLLGFLHKRKGIKVYLPGRIDKEFKKKIEELGSIPVEVTKAQEILDGVWSTGPLPGYATEQSLILVEDQHIVIVTGCAHPGIVKIVETAKALTHKTPKLVIGGFHLRSASLHEVQDVIEQFRKLGVVQVCPCHCTGESAISEFAKTYGSNYFECKVGTQLQINN